MSRLDNSLSITDASAFLSLQFSYCYRCKLSSWPIIQLLASIDAMHFGFILALSWVLHFTAALKSGSYSREISDVKLFFYAANLSGEIDISTSNYTLPGFDPRKWLKVLIHGWSADRNHVATAPVRNAYLVQDEHNLLVADWAKASALPYNAARGLVRPVGYRIGEILSAFIRENGIQPDQVHIVGHSLGAHIAGNVGKYFGGKLARVTALDPAGPLFVRRSVDAVSSSDAQFVDAIHTDGLVLGEIVARADVDFYPNQGVPSQPGCELLDTLTLHACSHYRSPAFFAESILLPFNFVAYRCELKEIFDNPSTHCGKQPKPIVMGERVNQGARGTYFLETSNLPPYGLGNRTELL
ncbi:pancreatic lipase-related protein 3-like [Sabethes cyaneus]|uniref:pancreatic lipase-related protein 3-like n=1 Tax=Sabethes cyaneus TaxID=53552 RepID=UPI00237DC62E|nr:pancreatic lipase-related protein 3-like [Sabethes cyaneus]